MIKSEYKRNILLISSKICISHIASEINLLSGGMDFSINIVLTFLIIQPMKFGLKNMAVWKAYIKKVFITEKQCVILQKSAAH